MSPAFKVQWKSLAILSLMTIALGCQGYLPPPDPPAHQGITLHVSCPEFLAELIRTQSRGWAGRERAEVRIVPASSWDNPAKEADVILLPFAELPRWVGKLHPVDPQLVQRGAKHDWNGLLPIYREDLLIWDKKPYGLPLIGESPLCVYRADLFDDPELRKKYRSWAEARKFAGELRPPAGWQELAVLAEFFREHHPSGKPSPSLPPLPSAPSHLDRLFYQVAASFARRAVRQDEGTAKDTLAEWFAFHFDLQTAKPRIATPGFVAALQLLQRLQACRPAESSDDPDQAFLDGQAVLAVSDASLLFRAQQTPALRDKVGMVGVPGSDVYYTPSGEKRSLKEGINRVPYLGGAGWVAVVPLSSVHPEAAWDFLADLTGPTRSMQIALEPRFGGGPTRAAQVLRDRWDSFGLDEPRSLFLKEIVGRAVMQHGIRNPVVCLRTSDEWRRREALDPALRRALVEGGDAAETLNAVSSVWNKMNADWPGGVYLREYRLSLGLDPN